MTIVNVMARMMTGDGDDADDDCGSGPRAADCTLSWKQGIAQLRK